MFERLRRTLRTRFSVFLSDIKPTRDPTKSIGAPALRSARGRRPPLEVEASS